jgi:hypothetical protein
VPSGDGRGEARKSLPPTSSRTSWLPSSGTETRLRVIAPSAVWASRTHHTADPPGASTGSAYRQPAGDGGSGVSGSGEAELVPTR